MVKKSKQQQLFSFSDEEKKLQDDLDKIQEEKEDYKNLSTKEKKVFRERKKKKEQEKEFHESVKQTKEYLSWGRCSGVPPDDRKWTSLKIKTFNKGGVYKLIWTLPLYEELYGSVTKQDLVFEENSRRFGFDNDNYHRVILSCEELFESREVINEIPTNLEYLENQDRFSEHLGKIQYARDKNVITFKWEYPSHIEKKSFFLGRKKQVDFEISRKKPHPQTFYEQIHYVMMD